MSSIPTILLGIAIIAQLALIHIVRNEATNSTLELCRLEHSEEICQDIIDN